MRARHWLAGVVASAAMAATAGGSPKYNEFPGVGHGSWGPAYDTKGLWEWLVAQKRAE